MFDNDGITENNTAGKEADLIFSLSDVTFGYAESEPVLSHVNFRIACGERVSILGANGCGKSTILKILAGLLFPLEGDFTAFGHKMDSRHFSEDYAKEYHRRVGYIFQDSDVQLFCSTVYEEIAFGPLQLGMDEHEVQKRVKEMCELMEIGHLLGKTPYKLSGGEKKKVALASVLILQPDILIMDEPTNDLDPRTQSWLIRLLATLHSAGKTLIFATHNLELVREVSDRAILFDENHMIAADLPVLDMLRREDLLVQVNLVDGNYHYAD